MFVHFLRENKGASGILFLIRLFLGYQWITAGWTKITSGFDASGFLQGAVASASGEHPAVQGWWATFLEGVAIPNVDFFNVLIPWGEFLVGLGLILGTFTTLAAFMGVVMNFAFLFSGTTSTNPMMVILGMLLLIAGYNAAKIGIDRWLIPIVKKSIHMRQMKPALHH
ncbi:DoxX family protein [Bacillus sp. es.036]|uniref:DoxX family protein n=1 Tax=Bacillus sp. es.036 TaxID=1761764 RepID=UPI000BF7D41A|nr:DoxX family protein [Bacillus sp. es.036]PFG03280.1 thiosulfate dehydrogenase [quinone] large subunit [Bacillus sp. es.036]